MPKESKPTTQESFGSFVDDSGTQLFDVEWDEKCFKLTGNEDTPLCFNIADAQCLRLALDKFLGSLING